MLAWPILAGKEKPARVSRFHFTESRPIQRKDHRTFAWLALFFRPKNRLDAKLALLLDQHADVVAENLAQHFVDHREVAFRAHVMTELAFDRGEGRFDVAPLVVVGQVFIGLELEVVERLLECAARCARVVRLERDERLPAHVRHLLEVLQ